MAAHGARRLLETGSARAPGVGFGPVGEGYVRMALVASEQRLHDVALRLKEFLKKAVVGADLQVGPPSR